MVFEKKERTLYLDAEEYVSLAALQTAFEREEDGFVRLLDESEAQKRFSLALQHDRIPFSLDEVPCMLSVCADASTDKDGVHIRLAFLTDEDPDRLSSSAKAQIRGVAFVTAFAMLGGEEGLLTEKKSIPLALYCHVASDVYGKQAVLQENPKTAALCAFWQKTKALFSADATYAIDRATRRLPTLSAFAFPFSTVREGQKDLMGRVYTVTKRGGTLVATAPTGTGKTTGTLYPALRAMGEGHIDKIFYLTPKTTSAAMAAEALQLFAQKGALVRGLHLHAKERLCPCKQERMPCRTCPFRRCGKQKEVRAAKELVDLQLSLIGEDIIRQTAAKHGVCPYELSLTYALYADVIIGDYNYLFDPRAYLRRFFDRGGRYAFLIDEAHNLPDRAREMYTGHLTLAALQELVSLCRVHAMGLAPLAETVKKAFVQAADDLLHGEMRQDETGEVCGFATQKNLPDGLLAPLRRFAEQGRKILREQRPFEGDEPFRDAVFAMCTLVDKLEWYDEHFLLYALRQGDAVELCFYCIDPSALLSARLDKGHSAVFFSATLSPIEYYRSVLCGERAASVLDVPSPFDPESLCIGIMDKISVRAVARENTLPEIAKIIATVMKARQGNYMVFCPSFAYMERVAEAFHNLAPKAPYAVQKRQMSMADRQAFLDRFSPRQKGYFVGFCVTGGIYAEGIDLVGDRLIGAIVIGVGLPQVSPEREIMASYYQDKYDEGKAFAYLYPGLNRILQAAGRVIRREDDRGVIVLIDDRFRDPACRKIFPPSWHHLRYAGDRRSLAAHLNKFWQKVDEEQAKDKGTL